MKKTSVQSNINLETLAGGAFAEKLNEALMQVAGHIPAEAVPEILAHELAHIVTVGDEHGPEWKKAFEAIYSKYNELAIARFGTQEPEENQKGGD